MITASGCTVNPEAPEEASTNLVITDSGREVLHYTGPYLILGILIYAFYGIRHSRLAREMHPAPW